MQTTFMETEVVEKLQTTATEIINLARQKTVHRLLNLKFKDKNAVSVRMMLAMRADSLSCTEERCTIHAHGQKILTVKAE